MESYGVQHHEMGRCASLVMQGEAVRGSTCLAQSVERLALLDQHGPAVFPLKHGRLQLCARVGLARMAASRLALDTAPPVP